MSVQVRPARGEDLEPCARLLDELFRIEADFTPDAVRQRRGLLSLLATDGARVLVAEDDGEVIGMLSVQRLVSTAEGAAVGLVEDVVVRAGRRGEGIGRALLRAVEDWAHSEGLTRLQLLAEQHNHDALAFYRRLGWGPTRLVAMRKMLR